MFKHRYMFCLEHCGKPGSEWQIGRALVFAWKPMCFFLSASVPSDGRCLCVCPGFPRAAHFHGERLFLQTHYSSILPLLRLIQSVSVFRYHRVYKPSSSAPLPCLLRERPVRISVANELSESFSIKQNAVPPLACAFTQPTYTVFKCLQRTFFLITK